MSLFDRIDFTGWRLSGFFGLCDLCVVYFVDSNSKMEKRDHGDVWCNECNQIFHDDYMIM